MTDAELGNIISGIEEVLNHTFTASQKRKVLKYSDRLNFACPYCGDSDNVMKKRGNVYLEDLDYHCFNCGKHTNYYRFLRDFGVDVDTDTIDMISSVISKKKGQKRKESFDLILFDEMNDIALTREEVRREFKAVEIPSEGKIHDYLKSRCLLRYSERFMYNAYRNELYVLNLTDRGTIAGFQIRSFDENMVKYRTYNISKIYEKTHRTIPEKYMEDIDLLNQISITFNLMQVSLRDTIYVFEGGIDSFFIPNSVGLCGVGRKFDLIEDLPNTKYFFDNDKAGHEQTYEKISEGKSVFLWSKFLDANGFDKKIKDLNELIVYLVKNRIHFDFGTIGDWFSEDALDIIDL